MTHKIILRRAECDADGWNAMVYEVAIVSQTDGLRLAYRESDDTGDGDVPPFGEWQGEKEALKFLLGFIPSPHTIQVLKADMAVLLDEIEPVEVHTQLSKIKSNY